MSDNASETPLIDLLRGVDIEGATHYRTGDGGHHIVPVGQYCHAAADRIAELESREVTGEPTEQDYELWARKLAGQPWDDVPAGARSMFIDICKSVWIARRAALQAEEDNGADPA